MDSMDPMHTMDNSPTRLTVARKNSRKVAGRKTRNVADVRDLSECSDAELLQMYRETRRDEAFLMVQGRYSRLVSHVLRVELPVRFADAETLEDQAQELWMKLLRAVVEGALCLTERESLKCYIARMAQNGARNFVQLKRNQYTHMTDSSAEFGDGDDDAESRNPLMLLVTTRPNPREHTEGRLLELRVRKGMRMLSQREQRVVQLMATAEMTTEQIAAEMCTNVTMVKRLKASAREKLRGYVF